ncbi:hypothetical protein ACTFIZ_012251 [Dictyostelium cf. discoideum]
MKYLLLLLFIFKIFSLTQGYCESCISEGEKCRLKNIEGQCLNGRVCLTSVKNGDDSNYTCQPRIKINQPCNDDFTCEFGLICHDGACKNVQFSNIGEECSQDSDCSSNKAKCSNGVCKNLDGICDNNSDCPNQECSDHLCYPYIPLGQTCTIKGISCIDNLECYSPNKTSQYGICQEIKKRSLGQPCDSSEQCNSLENLYCQNNICEKYIISNQTCDSDGMGCDEYHSCGCDGKCYLNGLPIIPNYQKFVDCYQNKCGGLFPNNEWSAKSCLIKKCAQEACDYFSFSSKSPFEFKCNQVQYQANYLCGLAKSNSNKLEISIISIFIFVATLLF